MLHELNGVRLNVIDEGHGQPILFLHSNGGSWRDWEAQLDGLADRHRCIAIDMRGYGQSDRGRGPFTIEQLADDAAAVLDLQQLEAVHVTGVSLGGVVAQALSIRHPERVRSLTLVNTSGRADPALLERVTTSAALIREGGMGTVIAMYGQATWSEPFRSRSPELVRRFVRSYEGNDPQTIAAIAESTAVLDHSAALAQLRVPSQIVFGDLDGLMTRADAELLAAWILGAQIRFVPDVGHMVCVEAPELFNEILAEFVSEHSA